MNRTRRNKGTGPELTVQRELRERRVFFRRNVATLAGKPDLFIPRISIAIFVHGCFWHQHNCRRGSPPRSNCDFWNAKLSANVSRDKRVAEELERLGIRVITIWACELKMSTTLFDQIASTYHAHLSKAPVSAQPNATFSSTLAE